MKYLKESIPVLYVYLVVICFGKSLSYFSIINIDIVNYVETTEILFGQFTSCQSEIICIIAITLLYYGVADRFSGEKNIKRARLIFGSNTYFYLACAALFSSTLFMVFGIISALSFYKFLISLFVIYLFEYECMPLEDSIIGNSKAYCLVAIFSFIYFYMGQSGSDEMNELLKYGSRRHYSFKYHDKVVKTDTRFTYVGDTKNYFFVYDRGYKTSHIYKKSEMDSIVINVDDFKK